MQNKKKVLFILSTNYAGSHYLSLLVGSHSKAEHVGEIRRFRYQQIHREPCFVCNDFEKCPLFQGIEPGRVEHIHEQIFRNLGDGTLLLVDNSKWTDWAERFLNNGAFETKFLHLIRDPRALVRRFDLSFNTPRKRWHQRWKLMRRRPERAFSSLLARQRHLYLHKWLWRNQGITRFLNDYGLEYHLMTYRDLATNTTAELEKLMAWLGLEFEPAQIEYWNFEHHGSQKFGYDWIKENKASYFDTRWKEYLSADEQIYCVNHPSVRGYLAQLGVRVTEEGLTRA